MHMPDGRLLQRSRTLHPQKRSDFTDGTYLYTRACHTRMHIHTLDTYTGMIFTCTKKSMLLQEQEYKDVSLHARACHA